MRPALGAGSLYGWRVTPLETTAIYANNWSQS